MKLCQIEPSSPIVRRRLLLVLCSAIEVIMPCSSSTRRRSLAAPPPASSQCHHLHTTLLPSSASLLRLRSMTSAIVSASRRCRGRSSCLHRVMRHVDEAHERRTPEREYADFACCGREKSALHCGIGGLLET
jgi:hypothetical protein